LVLDAIAKANAGKTVCIATHATPIRAVCTAAAGLRFSDMAKIPWTANASISLFEYENDNFKAIYTSNTDHLGDLRTKLPTNV
jgi:broad specificity phosphatase PhoE